jgi:photosystem II stability/assembly factor-like uncharacterized protein
MSKHRSVRTLASALAAAALLLAPPGASRAQDTTGYSAMRWRLIGPFRGGRALAVAGIPGNSTTFYFGAVDGGVWRTDNAALTWEPLFDAQPIASIGAMAVAPTDPRVIYVGTGEAAIRSDITLGGGVYKSTDGGAHWESLGLNETRQIGKVLVNATNADVVLVAALGHAYGPNAERGVFRSTDGGQHWTKVLFTSDSVGAIDLAADPGDANVVYAAMYSARRTPWSQYPPNEGAGSGIWKSTDGGATWTAITGHGLPEGQLARIGLAVGRGAGVVRVYALVGAAKGSGIYSSDDGGASWRLMGRDPRITSRNWYFCRVNVDPTNVNTVYVPNVSLLKSTDGGATFTPIKGAPGGDDYHELWIDPLNASHLLMGTDQGTTLSLDGGRTWSSWYNQPTAQFYHVAVDDRFPYRVYGAQQDIGAVAVQSRGDFGGITYRDWATVGPGESGYVIPDPLDSNVVYTGNTYGSLRRFDWVTGQSQDIAPSPITPFFQRLSERKYRFTWTSPLVFDPFDKHVLYFGAQQLLATRDGGLHWKAMSPDLTGAPRDAPKGRAPTVETAGADGWGVIYTIAPSKIRRGTIWVGTDNGVVQLTTDAGRTWRTVTPAGLPPWSKITMLEASPFDAGTAYAAVDRHRLDDVSPWIFRTRDGGAHWTRINDGIAWNAYAQVVRADPARRGLLYAGTELGVYVSFDDGDHWRSLQLNLPAASVRDLVVHDNDLVAATHGRSFWILDDVTILQQLDASVRVKRAHLFAPERAVRIRRSVSDNTPVPPEISHGYNPPAGAIIDYWLGAAPGGPVVVEILDARGRLVRRASSDDDPAMPTDPPQISAGWLGSAPPPTKSAGHNRYVWDLRYPPPPAALYSYAMNVVAGEGAEKEPVGPLALPGEYRVRLIVGADTSVRALRLVNDPRLHVSYETLKSQTALALKIWNAQADQFALDRAARTLRDALAAVPTASLDASARAEITSLSLAADSIANAMGDDLATLEGVVESADRAPTQQSRDAFAELTARLAAQQKRWSQLSSKDLPALNALLHAQSQPPVPLPSAERRAPRPVVE